MEQIKNIFLVALVLAIVILWFRSPVYEPPVFIDVPMELSDNAKQRIVNEANEGLVVATEAELIRRYGKVVKKTILNIKDSLRIQDSLHVDTLQYVCILTDSAFYDLGLVDSVLGVGFDLRIGLADTVLLEPYNKFVHEFWLDSLTWKLKAQPEVAKLNWFEWLVTYPEKVATIALIALIFGKL